MQKLMARILGVRSGPRDWNATSSRILLDAVDVIVRLRKIVVRSLGAEFPVFNPESRSELPDHVVVHVSELEVGTGEFPKPGYYLLQDVRPGECQELFRGAIVE